MNSGTGANSSRAASVVDQLITAKIQSTISANVILRIVCALFIACWLVLLVDVVTPIDGARCLPIGPSKPRQGRLPRTHDVYRRLDLSLQVQDRTTKTTRTYLATA